MDATTRIGIACLSLVVLWIAVYWITPAPLAENTVPRVTYQQPLRPTTPEQTTQEVPPDPKPDLRPDPDIPADEQSAQNDADSQGPTPGELIPPVFVEYTVQEGDNAWSIAERFYGSREHWASVLLSNPTVDARRLFRVGRVIKLAKDPNNIQGIIAGEEPPQQPRMDYIEYRVESGDSLSGISKAIYGRASLWRLIQSANADQVNSNGTNIRPGMILKIPPPPAD
ncbi:MAG: LysM peptidoglycan-binding domain-containing protein [Phycisphaerales bacterium JB065]